MQSEPPVTSSDLYGISVTCAAGLKIVKYLMAKRHTALQQHFVSHAKLNAKSAFLNIDNEI